MHSPQGVVHKGCLQLIPIFLLPPTLVRFCPHVAYPFPRLRNPHLALHTAL